MRPRIRGILFSIGLCLILDEIVARPTEEQSLNLPKTKESKAKTKQDESKQKQTKLALRDTPKSQQHGHRSSRITKPLKKSATFSATKNYNKDRKRQFIMHPMHSFAHPYMFMRPPPMTQRTIVTTRIPRPPMPIPYNPFLTRRFYGGMHHHVSPYSFFDPMRMYNDEDEEEEG